MLDSVTHQSRGTYPAGYDGVDAITTIRLGGDAARQIAFADSSTVTILDALTGAPVWRSESRTAPLAVVAVSDADGDGHTELLNAAGFIPSNRPAGLEVRDLGSGITKWLSDPTADADVYATAPYRIRVIDPLTPGGEKQILIAGTALYDGRVLLVGGRTHTLELKLGDYGTGAFASRAVKDAVMVDMDGDGVDDILAASEPQLSWVTGAQLDAYTQAGDLIWESVGMGGNDGRINGVFAIPPSLGDDDVVAVLPTGLRAYGRLNHLLDWTMEVPNDSAFLVEHGVNGPEIVFEKDNVLSVYDASTRTFLRDLTFVDPVDAALPLEGRIDHLLVSSGGHLLLMNGVDGLEMTRSDFLGDHLANRDQLAVETLSPSSWRIGVGSDVGVYRYRLDLSDRIFESGFEATP